MPAIPSTGSARRPFRARATETATPPRLVVVGNGMVGWRFCQALVDRGLHERFAITALGEERQPAYDRVHLTALFSGRAADDLALSPREWYARHAITLHTGDPVRAIDRAHARVTTASGRSVPYDRLVLATGSTPHVPPIEGLDLPGVHVYRTIEDVEAIRHRARQARRAAVVGGGLLGLEAAQALLDLGLEVTVLERGPHLMSRQLSPAAAALLHAKVAALGVRVRFNTQTVSAGADGDPELTLHFADRGSLETGLVVIAAGIRPRQELAQECGLACHRRGGIEVDDTLTTADPRIHAIGECASHRGAVYGLAAPGFLMAEVLAERLAGGRRRFEGAPLSARLKLLGVEVASLGESQDAGSTAVHTTDSTHRELIFRRGRLVGGIVVGPNPELQRLQDAAENRRPVWPWRRERFLRTGRLWDDDDTTDPALWPAGTIVCNCAGVSRGALTSACQRGCRTVDELARETRASTVCGSCRPLVAQIAGLGAAAAEPAPGWVVLLAVSLIALATTLAIALLPPASVGQSVEFARAYDAILTASAWRQATGFSVLGCAALSALLSLRKRLRRFTLGSFGWWRAAHAALGLAGLAALAAHTGFDLGDNFNRILMVDFLVLIALGACAGAVTALEARLDTRAAKRLRTFWTWTHVLAVWPLPALVTIHVLAAYYF